MNETKTLKDFFCKRRKYVKVNLSRCIYALCENLQFTFVHLYNYNIEIVTIGRHLYTYSLL